MRIIGERWTK